MANFRQRLGLKLPDADFGQRPLWIHCVSVGEVLAAKPVVLSIQKARPQLPVVCSTVTLTGQALAQKELSRLAAIFYFPFDWNFSVKRFLSRVQPRAVVLMETELWPNFLKACARRKIPVFVANGRISDRSLRRYRRVKMLTASMLHQMTAIGTQSHEDKNRFLELGADERRVRVTGNIKFDFPAPELEPHRDLLSKIKSTLRLDQGVVTIVVGSSMKGEEPHFLSAFTKVRQAISDTRMILAPRHPERFGEVADLLEASGVTFARRTELDGSLSVDVVLLDTIGELRAVYSLATVAVVGGSFLLPHGGHNPLEPAAFGKAIIFGTEMSNFREIAQLFLHEQAARQSTLESLPGALIELLQNTRARNILGQRAASTFRQNQGATDNTMDFLLPGIP
jgi:3-deoxy-D-manno-octulosonic-acid transferase